MARTRPATTAIVATATAATAPAETSAIRSERGGAAGPPQRDHSQDSGLLERDSGVQLVDAEAQLRVIQHQLLSSAVLTLLPPARGAHDRSDLRPPMGDQQHCLDARALLIVAQLFASLVLLGGTAGHLDEQGRIRYGVAVDGGNLTLAAH